MRARSAISTLEPTRYEVVLYVDGISTKRLGFTARRARGVLMDFARDAAQDILGRLTEAEQEMEWTYDPGTGIMFGGRIAVAYSGKTERDLAA